MNIQGRCTRFLAGSRRLARLLKVKDMVPTALLLGVLVSACHCEGTRQRTARVMDKDYKLPTLPRARVILTDAYGGRHTVESEVAATPQARTRGLMWRTQLPEGRGMLFIFPQQAVQTFWMKNTLMPLDMIFLNQALTVVGIIKHTRPRSLNAYGPRTATKYVLEVPGGWSSQIGLQLGSKVLIEGVDGLPVR